MVKCVLQKGATIVDSIAACDSAKLELSERQLWHAIDQVKGGQKVDDFGITVTISGF